VRVSAKGNAILTKCQVTRNQREAIWVFADGAATVEDCDLTGNVRFSWDVQAGARVERARNREDVAEEAEEDEGEE
jgi:hypothetical protein